MGQYAGERESSNFCLQATLRLSSMETTRCLSSEKACAERSPNTIYRALGIEITYTNVQYEGELER